MGIRSSKDRDVLMGGLDGAIKILSTEGEEGVVRAVREQAPPARGSMPVKLRSWDEQTRRTLKRVRPLVTFRNVSVVTPRLRKLCERNNGRPESAEGGYPAVRRGKSIHD